MELNRRTQGSLQIITQPQALNAMPWEKLANATRRCIIREYEVKEGKWFWINDCYYDTFVHFSFSCFKKDVKYCREFEGRLQKWPKGCKTSPKDKAYAGWEVTWSVFIDIYTEKWDLGQCFNFIYKNVTRSNICKLKLNEFNLEIKSASLEWW